MGKKRGKVSGGGGGKMASVGDYLAACGSRESEAPSLL